ncbi:tRNA 2-thiouridine(34) synthase MnmA [Candidatus Peregrinibacteria bacterium HGW-Peregrinibacteria-1]|jgi:tRNA-specific 2-thiouridylase|nr:MAG: tRNA 2-thiouridine(34) synthase MnmA [Candidatus Peregrinibacteria bacterium HGW-Peregrinibacteria-1]
MKVAVLVSGGVDSSVALRLLKEQGHTVKAFYLKIWLEDELSYLGSCPWEEDLSYVREICERLDVPLEVVPLQREYFDNVVDYTISEVKAGRTPNPDVMCNSLIKFDLFFQKVNIEEFDKVATGHYARIEESEGRFYLKTAPDKVKDQTYFLANLRQFQLEKLIFPIGGYLKSEVRELAEKFDLPNKGRRDSQGICFLGKFKYSDFIEHYLGKKQGDLIDYDSGEKVGEHDGYWYFTVGQRKGIKLPDGPFYVVSKDWKTNTVYVSKNYHDANKLRDTFVVENLNWFSGDAPRGEGLQVKLRHGPEVYDCEIRASEESKAEVKLIDARDQGIASGQFAVFYEGDTCLGAGVIAEG